MTADSIGRNAYCGLRCGGCSQAQPHLKDGTDYGPIRPTPATSSTSGGRAIVSRRSARQVCSPRITCSAQRRTGRRQLTESLNINGGVGHSKRHPRVKSKSSLTRMPRATLSLGSPQGRRRLVASRDSSGGTCRGNQTRACRNRRKGVPPGSHYQRRLALRALLWHVNRAYRGRMLGSLLATLVSGDTQEECEGIEAAPDGPVKRGQNTLAYQRAVDSSAKR